MAKHKWRERWLASPSLLGNEKAVAALLKFPEKTRGIGGRKGAKGKRVWNGLGKHGREGENLLLDKLT